jgi:diphthamide biosynthesis protein 4
MAISQHPEATYYEILGLSRAGSFTPQIIKAAYHRCLLQNHPDKAGTTRLNHATLAPKATFSIDQISSAYNILCVPKLRGEYDRELALRPSQKSQEKEIFKTGVEIVDLEDLEFDEVEKCWFRGCRCGDDRGFLLRESDLEDVEADGEIHVGCKGCSLWLKVLFGVVMEGGEEDSRGQKEGVE